VDFRITPWYLGAQTRLMPSRPALPGALPTAHAEGLRRPLAACLADPWFAELLFDCLPDVDLFVKDRQARYVVVSDGMVQRAGARSKQELLGRTTLEVFPPPLGRVYYEQDRLVLDQGATIRDRLELHFYPAGGLDRSCWYLTQKFPLHDTAGRIVGLAGTSRALDQDGDVDRYPMLARAIEHMRRNFDRPLRVEELAVVAELSLARFERAVKRIFRVTPVQLLAKTRLEAAAEMLAGGDSTIAEVAHACGYSDHSAFCRQFKATVDMTPTEFRAAVRRGQS
jgi:AraC-like DNA-binding protein